MRISVPRAYLAQVTASRDEESWAAGAVCAATGAVSEAYDRAGRQGAVDYLLHYEDGRTGALEVTSHAEPGSREVSALLARDGFRWPSAGHQSWTIAFEPNANVKRVRQIYAYVIETCEAHGVATPEDLPFDLLAHDTTLFAAAYEELGVRFHGSGRGSEDAVYVLPGSVGGGVDERLVHLPDVVTELLAVEHVAAHVSKLQRHSADERHLFIRVDAGGIPFPQYYPLCDVPAGVPTRAPKVPSGITHLWLATGYGPTLVGWDRARGWRAHSVFSSGTDAEIGG